MEAELQTYEFQLSQVSEALQADPGNEELTSLHGELQNLINLTRSLVGEGKAAESSVAGAGSSSKTLATTAPAGSSGVQEGKTTGAAPSASSSEAKKTVLSAGDECLAKYKADNRYYPARITSVGGSKDDPVYSIVFKGYNNSEMVRSWEIKPMKVASTSSPSTAPPSSARSTPPTASSSSHSSSAHGSEKKRASHPTLTPEEEAERERKKKRNEKKYERHETKAQVAQEKASSWQKFANKKKVAKKVGGQSSMFRTPEDPLAKVGVVGAGRGMTAYQDRSKHVYES